MKKPDKGQNLEGKKQSSNFSEFTKNLLEWRDEGFPEGGLGTVGEAEMRSTFRSQVNSEDGPEQLGNIVNFAVRRMELDDNGALLRESGKLGAGEPVSIIPQGEKLPPAEVLSDILRGKYDEIIRSSSEIKSLPRAYTFAIRSLKEILRDSREKILGVLGEFLVNYDVPESHIILNEYPNIPYAEGLEEEPDLRDSWRAEIKDLELTRLSIRKSFWEAYNAREQDPDNQPSEYALDNLDCVLPDDEDGSEAQLPRDSAHSVGDSIQPADDGSYPEL